MEKEKNPGGELPEGDVDDLIFREETWQASTR